MFLAASESALERAIGAHECKYSCRYELCDVLKSAEPKSHEGRDIPTNANINDFTMVTTVIHAMMKITLIAIVMVMMMVMLVSIRVNCEKRFSVWSAPWAASDVIGTSCRRVR